MVSPEIATELAPTGALRCAINLGNRAAVTVAEDGSLSGPCIDLAQALAVAAGVPLVFSRYPSAAAVTAAEAGDEWDIAFLAVDPARAGRLRFSAPYMSLEATYVVRRAASITATGDVDRPGHRIATSNGAAYDLHLQRTLMHAARVPFDTPLASFAAFAAGGLDAVAGLRVALSSAFGGDESCRLLSDSFLTIAHAVAVPSARRGLTTFIDAIVQERAVA